MIVFGGRGGRGNEGRVQVDGLSTGASINGGGVSGYRQDIENAAEIAMATSGGLGETEVGGPAMNIVPKTGGNTFQSISSPPASTATHAERQLHAASCTTPGCARPTATNYLYDTSVSSGGPIIKDRLWYFATAVLPRQRQRHLGMFYNMNAGDITKWTYVRRHRAGRRSASDSNGPLQPNLRLTFQVTPRNKLNLFWDEQISSDSIGQGSSTTAPETGGVEPRVPARAAGQVDVDGDEQAAARSRRRHLPVRTGTRASGRATIARLIQVTEQCPAATGCANNGGIPA